MTDTHQDLLNEVYDLWQTADCSRSELYEKASQELSDLHVFATLVGKYNQQVTNGGHVQYSMNCYAGNEEDSSEFHDMMIEFMETSESLKTSVYYDEVLDIMKSYNAPDEDEYEYLAALDTRYYEVYEGWMEDLETYFTQEVNK